VCTIALAWRALPDAPIAVAANRDEALDRESRPPRVLEEDPVVVGPQDAEAGGTWIGGSERGLVVAITNRWTAEGAPDLPAGRSRGLLVRDVLTATDTADAVAAVRTAVDREDYAGFNLLVADDTRATYLEWDGDLRTRELDPGVHVIVNPGINEDDERAERLRAALSIDAPVGTGDPTSAPDAWDWLATAAEHLRDHRYGVCIHREEFGTRSSSLLSVGIDGRIDYRFADGPPCRSAYEPVAVPQGSQRREVK